MHDCTDSISFGRAETSSEETHSTGSNTPEQSVTRSTSPEQDSLEIKQQAVSIERPQRQKEIADNLLNYAGFFIKMFNKERPAAVAKIIDHVEQIHGSIPLDFATQKKLFDIASDHPELFSVFTEFLNNPKTEADKVIHTMLKKITLSSKDAIETLSSLIMEVGELRILSNTQFNTDQFLDDPTRRAKCIEDFDAILSNPKTAKPNIYQYMTDAAVILQQQKYIDSAQKFARLNKFAYTIWWPATLSGRSMLFCADWDPPSQEKPDEVSRHIGIMLGNRMRITCIQSKIPDGLNREAFLKNPPEDFKKTCEDQIQAMHREVMSQRPPDIAVYSRL